MSNNVENSQGRESEWRKKGKRLLNGWKTIGGGSECKIWYRELKELTHRIEKVAENCLKKQVEKAGWINRLKKWSKELERFARGGKLNVGKELIEGLKNLWKNRRPKYWLKKTLKKQARKIGWNNRPHNGKISQGRAKEKEGMERKCTYHCCWIQWVINNRVCSVSGSR